MVAEVDEHQSVAAFPVKANHIDPGIHFANGSHDVGVVDAGIGLDRAVLHAEATDKGDVGGITDAIAHLGGLQVCQGHHSGIGKLAAQELPIFIDQFTFSLFTAAAGHCGAGVGVGGVNIHALLGQAGGCADIFCQDLGQILLDAAQVSTHQNDFGITAGQSQGINFQFVQNALSVAGLKIACYENTQHGSNVYATKTSK